MTNGHDKADDTTPPTAARRDAGVSFIEILVAVVLLGIGAVATLTALNGSIRGSDQHKSKVAALSELQGAGAFLQRDANEADCDTSTPDPTVGFYQGALAMRPGDRNANIEVVVEATDCTTGLPVVSLMARDIIKQNAVERLDVVVGGVSVDKKGDGSGGSGGPGPGACVWGTVSATPVTVNKSGPNLAQAVSVRLQYTGDCSSATATAQFSQPAPNPKSYSLAMTNSGSGVFEATLPPAAVNWKKDDVTVTVTTSAPSGSFVTSFTVT